MWFGQPQCPVNKDIQFWLEGALEWLWEEFGRQALLQAEVVLPHPQYFPDQYDGSRASIRQVMERVCRYMRINPDYFRQSARYLEKVGPLRLKRWR